MQDMLCAWRSPKWKMKRAWFILVWAVLVAGRGQCEPNEWRSPLFVRNAEPLNMLLLNCQWVTHHNRSVAARIAPDFHLHFGLIWYLKRS